ncbi:fimbrial protein [Salmonella enterica]|nr:fimbrial protein [Salmonella enterica]ELP9925421.1 fimbrial protein [Salmonella enterica]
MKKSILSAVIVMSALGGGLNANAANGEVNFIGAVTATTCDLSPEVSGSITNMVQLGTAGVSAAATPVEFVLKPNSAQAGCTGLLDSNVAEIAWGGQFNATGLENQGGSATGAWVKLTSVNSKANGDITSSSLTSEFAGDKIKDEGAKFNATLNGGSTAGDYKSAAAFVVAYK